MAEKKAKEVKDDKGYQNRVVKEKSDLDSKVEKLTVFIDNDKSGQVELGEKHRLRTQLGLMKKYSAVLADRIAAFK